MDPETYKVTYTERDNKMRFDLTNSRNRLIYTATVYSSTMELHFGDGTLLASARLHKWESQTEITLHSAKSKFMLQRLKDCKSFPFNGYEYFWKQKNRFFKDSWRLFDEKGRLLASLEGYKKGNMWNAVPGGPMKVKFEIVAPDLDQHLVAAILITGFSEMENERRQAYIAAVGTYAGSSAAAMGFAAIAAS